MSDNIDWSKAPEGTTHYCDKASYPWLRDSDHPDFFHEDRGEWRAYGRAEYGKRHIAESVPRPTSQPETLGEPTHPDNLAVHGFANAMRLRLSAFLKLNGVALGSEPVEWDGTGLPPVGTLVGVHYSDQAPYEALVVAEHLGEVVLWIGNGARTNYWRCDPAWLRPILTPEQRAAKERDEAVAAMLDSSGLSAYDNVTVQQVCEALHAAGYRKTEGE